MGTSFSTKPFVISSLNDAIYLLSTAKYGKLTPDASVDQRRLVATSLAVKAQDYVVPLAKACLATFSVHYKAYVTWVARQAFEKKEYHQGVGLLLESAKKSNKKKTIPDIVIVVLQRLLKAFVGKDKLAALDSLLLPDGPGVLLLELAARYEDPQRLATETNIFAKIRIKITMNLRGSLVLNKGQSQAIITCGVLCRDNTTTTRNQAQKQIVMATQFLQTYVQTVFENHFRKVELKGYLFVPSQSKPDDPFVENGVSFAVHEL